MSEFSGAPVALPGLDPVCADRLVEVERREWRIGEGGDPARIVADFCDRYAGGHRQVSGSVCGVAVLVSAAAGAVMVGGAAGAPSPSPGVPDVALVAYRHGPARRRRPAGAFSVGKWRRSWAESDHAKAVVAVQEAIGRGDVYQACLVGHRSAEWSGDPAAGMRAVRAVSGAAWGGSLTGADWAVASGSPECFLAFDGHRAVTRPIKGTAPASAAGRAALLESVKERAEHVMIVDLERNDLARVAVPGSVAVEELFAVRRWADLWQAESRVACEVEPGVGLDGLLRAVCPPGSVTGTPKLAMLDLVASLEPVGRGPSMGALGFWSGGVLSLGLTIRTVAFEPGRVHVWAGGGITWRSVPGDEVAEAEAKARGVTAALVGAAGASGCVLGGSGGLPDCDGAFFGFVSEVVGPFGAVEAESGGGGVEFDDAAECHGRVGMDALQPDRAAGAVAGDLYGPVF